MKKVIIIGGGIAGLISALRLAKAGIEVEVLEKKMYPFHRVCGEYISFEAVRFLKELGVYPEMFLPPRITRFQLTSVNGKSAFLPLDPGGFGISRFSFDNFLYEEARKAGVVFHLNTAVEEVRFDHEFEIRTSHQTFFAGVVIAAYGKRSRLDKTLNRAWSTSRSPYAGVKYHIRCEHPADLIALHNFKGGYCGISAIEDGQFNLCYLTHRANLKAHHRLQDMEQHVLFKNPFLKSIFQNSDFLFDTPLVINEISFEPKSPVENHMLMAGDAAGMITPLCGNGMAMAIHSAKLASEAIMEFYKGQNSRQQMEVRYARQWRRAFSQRLWAGRQIQKLFGGVRTSDFAVNLALYARPLAKFLVHKTHGKTF